MLLNIILGLPKTIYFNFVCFPLKTAIHLPIILAPGVKLKFNKIRNNIIIKDPRKKVYIGFTGSFNLGEKTFLSISDEAGLVFNGKAVISKGCKIIVDSRLEIGDNFFCNSNCIINAGKEIVIGDNCTVGWRTTILDGDGHKIFYKEKYQSTYEPIRIEDRVWLASDVTILKGCKISEGSVVATKACISKSFSEKNILIGGYNKILKKNITWEI